MKKLLAILLALMMVLVSVTALAADGDPVGETPAGTEEPAGGDAASTTPAATTNATAKDPSVDTGYNETTKPKTGLDASVANDVTVNKKINVSGTGANVPTQTVSFTVGAGTVTGSSATAPVVTIDDVDFTEILTGENKGKAQTEEVTIHLLPYTSVGVYTYDITETDTNVAGMKYATDLELKITVINGEIVKDGAKTPGLVIAGIALRQKNVKTDTMENDYVAHALTVGKTVDGNLGDKTKAFPITVVLTAPEGDLVYGTVDVTITGTDATVKDGSTDITTSIAAETSGWATKTLALSLKDGQSVKFENLPDGVTYTVIEDDTIKHLDSDMEEPEKADSYKVDNEVKTATALTADATVDITNTKNIEVDTGVALDSTVYMLIMALALAGFAALKVRRREEN